MARSFPFRTRDGREGVVRVARARDARACLRIVGEAAHERPRTLSVLEGELWSPRAWRAHRYDWGPAGVTLVALLGRQVVGQLTAERGRRRVGRHEAEFGVTVASAARSAGVGRALLTALEAWAGEFGVDRITLHVFVGNARARGLYRSIGYEEEGIERRGARFPEGDVDVVMMAKLLPRRRGSPRAGARGYDEHEG